MGDFFASAVRDWHVWFWIVAIPGVVILALNDEWRFWIQRLQGKRARDWPTIQATIDNVSVCEQVEQGRGGPIITYLATLTYFYRNPDLQVGDYVRLFEGTEKDSADDWVNSYKGKTVTVHLDPHDPTRSVLREEDL